MSTELGEQRIKVLYIAGVARSGSTILGNVLGELEGAFPGGELVYTWRDLASGRPTEASASALTDGLCGCQRLLRECPEWNAIMSAGFGSPVPAEAKEIDDVLMSLSRLRHFPRLVLGRWLRRQPRFSSPPSFLTYVTRLYGAIHAHTGCSVIVDTSKNPSYACLLAAQPNLDVYLIHLVRDPRAETYSRIPSLARTRRLPRTWRRAYDLVESEAWLACYVALEWVVWHGFIALAWLRDRDRYMLVRYEDFARDPQSWVKRIGTMLEVDSRVRITDGHMRINANHNVCGNQSKFRAGDVEIKLDVRWRTRMHRGLRALVLTLTWPSFLFYYHPRRESSSE